MQDHIGKTIKKYRQIKGMTQKELAELIHVEHSTISNWELGKRNVDLETARRLSVILGFSLDDSSETDNVDFIYQNIRYRHFKYEIQKSYMLVKLLIIMLYIGFSITVFAGNIGFITGFLVLYIGFLFYDTLLLFKPKVDIDYYQVRQNKKLYLKRSVKEKNMKKSFIKKLFGLLAYYLILMAYLSLSLTFLYALDVSSSYVYISSIFILTILFFMLAYREMRIWKMKNSFDYKQFQYKKDLFINRLMIVIFDILILFTLSMTSFYIDALTSTSIKLFLYISSILYYGIGYSLYIGKLYFLSEFTLYY